MSEQPVSSNVPEWTIGDRLRKALAVSGVKVSEMADELEVERNTIGNYMAGRTRISGAALKLWAMRTGVPLEWIRTGDASPGSPGGGAAGRVSKRYQHLMLAAA